MLYGMHVSWLAVILAAVAQQVIGMVWYNPKVFGGVWAESLGMKIESLKCTTTQWISSVVIALVTAFVLALFIDWTGAGNLWEGAIIGLWAAIGFNVVPHYSAVVWAKKPVQTYIIDASCEVVIFVVMGAIIGALR